MGAREWASADPGGLGFARTGPSVSCEGSENSHQPEECRPSLAAVGRGGFEFEEIKNGQAFERTAARDGVVACLVARR